MNIPYRIKTRWEDMKVTTEGNKKIAKTKKGIYPKFAFWLDDELYQDYLSYCAGTYTEKDILEKEYLISTGVN